MKTLNCALVLGFLFLAGTNLWAVSAGFNIQGRLTDPNGVNKEDGDYSIKFSVYANDIGGSPVWEKNMPDANTNTPAVHVQNGNFQVVLQGEGKNQAGAPVLLENAVKDLAAAYLEIKVGSENPLVPRQQLLRSPFSPPIKFTGAVMFFAGAICPDGWLLADGRILPVTGVDADKQVELFNYLGTVYDPVHVNVKLPNLVDGAFIRGIGGNADNLGSKQSDALKTHTHNATLIYRNLQGNSGGTLFTTPNITTSYGITTSGPSTGDSVETRPLNYAMTPCIKY